MKTFAVLALALSTASAFVSTPMRAARSVTMSAEAEGSSRRAFMVKAGGLAAAAAAIAPQNAEALVDYAGLPYLGGGDKIDLNNANIRAYLRLPGMYPSIAGKITSTKLPFKNVGDVYNIKGLTDKEKAIIKSYESKGKFIVLEPAAEYVMDRTNNGLYR